MRNKLMRNLSIAHKSMSGFTIVELVVVIAVIGILVAIAIVSYGPWRTQIAQAEVKHDLSNALTAMENSRNYSKGYPLSIPSAFESSKDVEVVYISGNDKGFCIQAQSDEVDSVRFFIDTTSGKKEPQEGVCPIPGDITSSGLNSSNAGYSSAFEMDSMGNIYYIYTPNKNLYKLSSGSNTPTLVKSSIAAEAIYDIEINYQGNTVYFAADTEIIALDLGTGVKTVLQTGLDNARALYLDGDNTLYIGGRRNLYRLDIASNSLQTLYGSISNIYFWGITKVGSKLYLPAWMDFYEYNISTNTLTIKDSNPPVETSTGDVETINNKLYMIMGTDLYYYDLSDFQWTSLKTNIKTSTCVIPQEFDIHNNRLHYFSFTNSSDFSICGSATDWSLYKVYL